MLARAAQHRNDENDEHNDLNSCPDYLLKRWQQQRAFDASRQSSKWAFSCLAVVSWAAEHPVCLSIAQPSPSWGKGIRQKSRHHWQKTLSVTTFYSPLISSSSSFKWDFDLNFPLLQLTLSSQQQQSHRGVVLSLNTVGCLKVRSLSAATVMIALVKLVSKLATMQCCMDPISDGNF